MELEIICTEVRLLVRKVGGFIREERKLLSSKNIEKKGKQDFVTHVDKAAEERLVHGLKDLVPGAGFIAEEGTGNFQGDVYNWIIDPIDGTTNFIHGVAPHAISIALNKGNETLIGVVYEIIGDECFYSWKGAKAFLDNTVVSVSNVEAVSDSLLATGFPYDNFKRMEPFMNSLEYFFLNTHGVRRLGSAAVDLAYVACGRYDGFYEYNLKPWDLAAGAFLVQQAGGKVSDFAGTGNYLNGKEVIASNSQIFKEFQETVFKYMGSLYE
jgi:myo-inositol-1(or 4)-monophosphatase